MLSLQFRVGDRVYVRGRRWRVREVVHAQGCSALGLVETAPKPRELTVLTPFDRPRRLGARTSLRVVRPRRWLHDVDRTLAGAHPFGGLKVTAGASIQLLPYQLEPALALSRKGATRILIADAVGLGKTVQAGVILNELAHASHAFRAVVLTPAGLREQWAAELRGHFNLQSVVADARWLRLLALELPRDINPWSLPGIYVTSHDFVKRPETLRALEDVRWDLVIVDEAHTASLGSDRRAAIHAIASRALRVVSLTATPHAGDAAGFQALCNLGRLHQAETPPVFFSRSRSDVECGLPRRSVVLGVAPTRDEREMHHRLESYSIALWKEGTRRGDERARLASIVLRKRALSSAGSLASSVQRRLELLASGPVRDSIQLTLPLDDEDPLEDVELDHVLGAPGLDDRNREKKWLNSILAAARIAARDESKLRVLGRLFRRIREPIIVFTEYRDTLTRLRAAADAARRATTMLHGGMSPAERTLVPEQLGASADLLLATDAAAEGLNLHHRCRIVVHYELPWNPARLEQRAGRVDRIGQAKRTHEIALVASSTAERLVVAPLAARARATPTGYRMLGRLGESRVAEAVMTGSVRAAAVPAPPAQDVLVPADLRAEATAEAMRLAEVRRLTARSGAGFTRLDASTPAVSMLANRRRLGARSEGRLVLVYLTGLETADGQLVHTEPFAVAVSGGFHLARHAAQVRTQLALVLETAERELHDLIHRHMQHVSFSVAVERSTAMDALRERGRAIAGVRLSAARALVQPALFRRKLEREAPAPALSEPDAESTEPLIETVKLAAALFLVPPTSPQ